MSLSVSAPARLGSVWSLPAYMGDETKSLDFNSKKGILTGYLTLYNSPVTGLPYVDSYLDICDPGMCTKTIQELYQGMKYKNVDYLIPYLWQHLPTEQIGGVKHLKEESKGVVFETHLARGIQRAEEALILLDQKMSAGISYGYDPIRVYPDNGKRHLKEIRLHEKSQVTFPAHEYAAVQEVKSWCESFYQNGARVYQGASLSTKQARDFNTLWQNQQPDEIQHELYMITSTLSSALTENLNDDSTDPQGTVNRILAQAAPQLQEWAQEFCDCMKGGYTTRDGTQIDAVDMMGYMSMDTSVVALKDTVTRFSSKDGRKISDANRKRLQDALKKIHEHAQSIQAMLDETMPTKPTGKAQVGSFSTDILGNTQVRASAPIINPALAMDAWFKNVGSDTPLQGAALAPLSTTDSTMQNFLATMRESLQRTKGNGNDGSHNQQ